MPGHLFIVARGHPELYGYLSREFSAEKDVHVMMDRRAGDRRRLGERRAMSRGDRRHRDRRSRAEATEQISSLGYTFIRLARFRF
jgi:hypothetical protein